MNILQKLKQFKTLMLRQFNDIFTALGLKFRLFLKPMERDTHLW